MICYNKNNNEVMVVKILIGTKNPGKIQGAKEAFINYFDNVEIEGIPVSSEVSEEPVNNEIYEGALNRVDNLIKFAEEKNIEEDYYSTLKDGKVRNGNGEDLLGKSQ